MAWFIVACTGSVVEKSRLRSNVLTNIDVWRLYTGRISTPVAASLGALTNARNDESIRDYQPGKPNWNADFWHVRAK